jgi:long-subunit acyl-CoA synthetase (AMP-forming)
MLSHDNITWTARTVLNVFSADPQERMCSFLPLSHIAVCMYVYVDVYVCVCVRGARALWEQASLLQERQCGQKHITACLC